jgi:hypothetical protein
MVSIRTASCNSPRPATSKAPDPWVWLTWMATLPSASRTSLSNSMRDVTLLPSCPASGELLMEKVMARVDGSMGSAASASDTVGSQMVSATVAVPNPAMATMSPADASSSGTRSSPRKANSLVMRVCSISVPSRDSALAVMLGRMVPERMRPVSSRPR